MSSIKKRHHMRKYARKRRRIGQYYIAEEVLLNIVAIVVILFGILYIKGNYFDRSSGNYSVNIENVKKFAIPNKSLVLLQELSQKYKIDFTELVTVYSLENNFFPDKYVTPTVSEIEQQFIMNYQTIKKRYPDKKIANYLSLFGNLFKEIQYFPIPRGYDSDEASYMYGDSYGTPRSYGGERTHLGTDVLDRENVRGRIPIVSMTDGVIENIGWNELGGFRIGIRSTSNNYYYYAHFDQFAQGLVVGTQIKAGQFLGLMGDTGYGKKEGTKGSFPVHLHVGMLIDTKLSKEEFWINPYAFLRFIEGNKIAYDASWS